MADLRAHRWRAILARLRGTLRPAASLSGSARQWPALAGIVGFAWLELVYLERDALDPGRPLARLLPLMVVGMPLFGVEQWRLRADGFGAYFNLLSRLSPS